MSTKLHELLAVKENVDGQATKTRTELTATFDKKRHLFEESRKTFTPLGENEKPVTEEQKDIQTTVTQEIEWISKIMSKAIDVNFQIDLANSEAKSDVVLEDGTTILAGIPATNLLQLERRMNEIKLLVDAIPTLDPTKGFKADTSRGRGIFRAREVQKPRTKKVSKVLVLVQPTKEHPAQAQLISEDEKIGTIQELEWSSMITPTMKADILERLEDLARAVKKARAKANEHQLDVAGKVIGKKIFNHIFAPLNTPSGTAQAAD